MTLVESLVGVEAQNTLASYASMRAMVSGNQRVVVDAPRHRLVYSHYKDFGGRA